MKRVLLLLVLLPGLALASKSDVSAPAKVTPPTTKTATKPAPRTEKRVLRLDLKK